MSTAHHNFAVVVVGGGHAGIEAAHAAARLGCRTALVSLKLDAIGRMSCNPAIGGQAKGQMVREIDALGGVMGLATDANGIQFRMLNRSHGPAVWGPRAQCDKAKYAAWAAAHLATVNNLTLIEGSVEHLHVDWPNGREHAGRMVGVTLHSGLRLAAHAVVITTGTFLRGLMHTGELKSTGGRVGEAAAIGLSASLAELGFELGRLKTGTPPRLKAATIDWSVCELQPGDDPPTPFSYLNDPSATSDQPRPARSGPGSAGELLADGRGLLSLEAPSAWSPPLPQVCCHITHTTPVAHALIRANLHRAPMFSGQIQSMGPRYCPSIEDKVVKFAEKDSHHIFLEPEGLDTDWVYCNGISTSLPRDVQQALLPHIPGLERAEIVQFGYAVEYDFVPPNQTGLDLQTKRVSGLFLAGQINGTSGYEEAAAQGLMAGINASRFAHASSASGHAETRGRAYEPLILKRHQAYIGVMIDDLVTRPPTEPYRMFTSRAEYRLALRSDNADVRLTPIGREIGLVDDRRWSAFTRKLEHMECLRHWLQRTRISGRTAWDMLRNPNQSLEELATKAWSAAGSAGPTKLDQTLASSAQSLLSAPPSTSPIPLLPDAVAAVVTEARYAGYIDRQNEQVARMMTLEDKPIPRGFDFARVPGLAVEARQKLEQVSPTTLGQASRISGISPADVTVLLIALRGS